MLHQTTPRWERSEVAFGPLGRVAVTVLLFVPVWFGISSSMVFLLPAAVWLFILPMALHHIWHPATEHDDPAWPILRPHSTEPILRPHSTEPILRPQSVQPILRAIPAQLRPEVEAGLLVHSD